MLALLFLTRRRIKHQKRDWRPCKNLLNVLLSNANWLIVCCVRGTTFEEEGDGRSREYREDDYDKDSVGSKHSNTRVHGPVPSKASFQWPEGRQAAAGEKKVINNSC